MLRKFAKQTFNEVPISLISSDMHLDKCYDQSSSFTNNFVSIIVPAYFSASTIEECLKSLRSQKYLKENPEIIVIDSGNDNTKDICRNYGVLYYHSTSKLSAGEARNVGARKASGQILAFIDADCTAPDNWVYHLICDLENFPKAFGIFGVYAGGKSGLDKVRGGELMKNEKRMGLHHGFIEGNVAFRKDVFDAGCSFGDMTYGECIKMSKDLIQRNMRTLWDPTLKVFHKGHLSYKRMFSMDRAYARVSLELERKALTKGLLKLLYLTAIILSIPFWPLVAGSLMLILLIVLLAYSISDKMVSPKHRVRYLPILVAMRFSRLFASAIEALLYLWRKLVR